jgi:hypothetical protein
MRFRKLRIAWSVAWGVAAVLFCVLFVTSLNHLYKAYARVYDQYVEVSALRGRFGLQFVTEKHNWTLGYRRGLISMPVDSEFSNSFPVDVNATWGFSFQHFRPQKPSALRVWRGTMPCLFLVTVCSGLAWACWLPWRFTLRTLLIATTLVAVVLGLIAWAARS